MLAFRRSGSIQRFIYFFNFFFVLIVVRGVNSSPMFYRIELRPQALIKISTLSLSSQVKIIMATNRPDTLDPALLRPGRLDRKIGKCTFLEVTSHEINLNRAAAVQSPSQPFLSRHATLFGEERYETRPKRLPGRVATIETSGNQYVLTALNR